MADTICEVVSEYLVGSDSTSLTLTPTFAAEAPATMADLLQIAVISVMAITGGFSDTRQANSAAYIAEQGALGDSSATIAAVETIHGDSADLSDAVLVARTEVFADAAVLSDALEGGSPSWLLADTAALSDSPGPGIIKSVLAEAAATAAETLYAPITLILTDAGAFGDELFATVPQHSQFDETGTFSDDIEFAAAAGAILTDIADASEAMVSVAHVTAVEQDEGVITETLFGGRGSAWSVPTDTFAMSRWETVGEFDSIAEIDGILYAAGANGLYRLDAGAEAIPGRIRGGLTDFGDPALKHASYYYAGYTNQCPGPNS